MNVEGLVPVQTNPNIPEFGPGDTVRVHFRITEGGRERVQVFEGTVLRIRRGGPSATFTVRRVSHGVGVERTFPLYSPRIEKVEVVRRGRVRRARLYYLRERVGRAAKIKERTTGTGRGMAFSLTTAEAEAPESAEEPQG